MQRLSEIDEVNEKLALLERIKIDLDTLTDDERSSLFSQYCRYCGSKDPRCQCWNDE